VSGSEPSPSTKKNNSSDDTAGSDQTFRVSDLAGCVVFTVEGERLGELVDVLPSGGNDIFVVKDGEKELLIPALKTVVTRIDLKERRIDVTLPNGLRELYEAL
jgi:16S rRNA processing protein RimM